MTIVRPRNLSANQFTSKMANCAAALESSSGRIGDKVDLGARVAVINERLAPRRISKQFSILLCSSDPTRSINYIFVYQAKGTNVSKP